MPKIEQLLKARERGALEIIALQEAMPPMPRLILEGGRGSIEITPELGITLPRDLWRLEAPQVGQLRDFLNEWFS